MDSWPYLYNQWYALAWSAEIGRELTERTLFDESLVLYRTAAGAPVALSNRCIHHHYPLSRGRLVDDRVECGYHGFTYDRSGKCVRIPGQERIGEKMRLRAYPVAEKWKWIWVWAGEPARADASLIPDLFWMDDPGWEAVGSSLQIQARHQLLNENLLDLSHVEFVHRGSIGAQDLSEFPIETTVGDGKVRISRAMTKIEASPVFAKTMGLSGLIDRWQVAEFTPPCYHVVHVTAGPLGARPEDCCQYKSINAVIPETRNRTRYLWAISRNYRRDQKWVSDYLHEAIQGVFMQDVAVCEAQEQMLSSMREPAAEMPAGMDAGVMSARRLLQSLKSAEEEGGYNRAA